jgi:hypothetical protein
MKAYLVTSGSLFGLIALMHVLRLFAEWQRMKSDLTELSAMVGLGILAAGLCYWAFRLFVRTARS